MLKARLIRALRSFTVPLVEDTERSAVSTSLCNMHYRDLRLLILEDNPAQDGSVSVDSTMEYYVYNP